MRPAREAEDGIVLGRQDLGETDRIVRLLSPWRGRVSVVARHARGPRSRWSGLDVGVGVRFSSREARGGLEPLVTAEVRDPRVRVRTRLETLALAAYACDAAGALAREGEAEPRLYGLLETLLVLLDALDDVPPSSLRLAFEAKLLTFAGIAPVLTRCTACVEPLDGTARFVPHGGGMRHARCLRDEDGSALLVSLPWALAVESLRRVPLREGLDLSLPSGPTTALSHAVAAHLGRELPSRAVLDALIETPS